MLSAPGTPRVVLALPIGREASGSTGNDSCETLCSPMKPPTLLMLFLAACGGRVVDVPPKDDLALVDAGAGGAGGSGSGTDGTGDPGTAWVGTYVCSAQFSIATKGSAMNVSTSQYDLIVAADGHGHLTMSDAIAAAGKCDLTFDVSGLVATAPMQPCAHENGLILNSFVATLSGNQLTGMLTATMPTGAEMGTWTQTLMCQRPQH